MGRGVKIILLNDQFPERDLVDNGKNYKKETLTTWVIYEAFNEKTKKSYIGKARSYEKHGSEKEPTMYGGKGRFKRHWSNAHNSKSRAYNDCPIFYEALRNSDILDWFIYVWKVCDSESAAEWEKKFIEEHKTSNPKKGYNINVGDDKPNDPLYLLKYQSAKAASNAARAANGALKKKAHNKDLPANINYRKKTNKDGSIGEGYFVQIKIDGHLYNKAFLSSAMTMEDKLEAAKKTLDKFKVEATTKRAKYNKPSGSKTTRSSGRK